MEVYRVGNMAEAEALPNLWHFNLFNSKTSSSPRGRKIASVAFHDSRGCPLTPPCERRDKRAEMRDFMDHVHLAFYEATGWRRDNSYAALNATSDALLNFAIPRGIRLTLSSLASPNLATSYQLGSVGVVDGSIAYLFSSVPLPVAMTPQSAAVPLPDLLRAYRPLTPLPSPLSPPPCVGAPLSHSPSLLYGRLYLPQSQLEALVVRRVSPALQMQLSAVSAAHLRHGGTVLALAQYDVGKHALEGLASTDGGLLGLRGVYNFGGDASSTAAPPAEGTNTSNSHSTNSNISTSTSNNTYTSTSTSSDRIYGRFSTGGEVYYGTLNKSGGISLGARFATLPAHRGTPLSATLTLNPLMGNVAATYAVVAGRNCSLATRMDFNVLSYESAWAVGMELWRRPLRRLVDDDDDVATPTSSALRERSWQAKLEWRLDEEETKPAKMDARSGGSSSEGTQQYAGVLKTRVDQNLRIGVLWEGRVKSLLFSLGSDIDLKRLDRPFRTLGLEIQFSS